MEVTVHKPHRNRLSLAPQGGANGFRGRVSQVRILPGPLPLGWTVGVDRVWTSNLLLAMQHVLRVAPGLRAGRHQVGVVLQWAKGKFEQVEARLVVGQPDERGCGQPRSSLRAIGSRTLYDRGADETCIEACLSSLRDRFTQRPGKGIFLRRLSILGL
jgi:hypothetical protein